MLGVRLLLDNPGNAEYMNVLVYLEPILEKDSVWHFFNEKEQGLEIRFSEETEDSLLLALDYLPDSLQAQKVVYEYTDPHPIVNKYKKYFISIFHEQSLLSLELYKEVVRFLELDDSKDDIDSIRFGAYFSIFERELHSLYNKLMWMNTEYSMQSKEKFSDSEHAEAFLLANLLINRAEWAGRRAYFLDKYKENKG